MASDPPPIEFRVLGGLELRTPDGRDVRPVLAQPKRLALLAFLAAARPRGFHRRDTLVGLFWPELDQKHARGALRKALQFLRHELGERAITTRGDDEVGLERPLVWCDAAAFGEALEEGRGGAALELYRGELLPGFFLRDVPEFERWLDGERAWLRESAARAARLLCAEHEAQRHLGAAVEWARRAAALDPDDERAQQRLIALLDRAGDRGGALRAYEDFARRLAAEYGAEPATETKALVARVLARTEAGDSRDDLHPRVSTPESAERADRPRSAEAVVGGPEAVGPAFAAASDERDAAPGRTVLGRRAAFVGGAALMAMALVGTALAMRGQVRGASDDPGARKMVAVLPFSVHGRGEFPASLAHGMVDLLSRDLDGLQRIRTVDPNAVLTRAGRFGADEVADEARGRDIARQLGAGLYVLGGVNVVGARLRIQAALFEAGDPGAANDAARAGRPEAVARASVEGDTTQLFALVDRLAADLMAHRYRGPGGRLVETAAATTHSLAALRAYLDAEEHLRNARFDSATAGFQRAVAADSTFALAHYRLGVAHDLSGNSAAAAMAAERALAFAGRLGERERRLVEAHGAFVRGAADDAERAYRSVLLEYPDDLEARFLLGRTLGFLNPARGRTIAEARPEFDAVLAADPEFLCPI